VDSINSPEEMIEMVKDVASKYIGKTFTHDLKDDITEQLSRILEGQIRSFGFKVNKDAVKFEKDPVDNQSMIPANLYTLLLMIGILVDYEEVKDKTEYTMENGTVIVFEAHSSRQIIKPSKPLEYVKINFTLDPKKINLN
jgi:hypothetical protein